jgi:hypothetical protein
MIIKSTDRVIIPDGEYYGIWSDDNICVPFIDGDYHFTVDATARSKNHPHSDIDVFVNVQNGWAFCQER